MSAPRTPPGDDGPIQALIFDMDGLLVDSEGLAAEAVRAFLARHGHEPRPDLGELMLGRRVPEGVALLAEAYALPGELAELTRVFDELRLAAIRGRLKPLPGAAALITFARHAGLRLALASSGLRSHVDLSLAETGLAGLFDAEATGDDVERGKPEPDIFLLAAARLSVAPDACVVLEDAPAGIAAAAAAGMRSLRVPPVGSRGLRFPAAPNAILPDLAAAIPWLEERGVRVRA